MMFTKNEDFGISINLHCGNSISAAEVMRQCSADLYQTDIHYRVAKILATSMNTDSTIDPVLHNLLALKSVVVRQITAAAYFVEKNRGQVAGVAYPRDLELVFRQILPDLKQSVSADGQTEIVSAATARTIIVKALLHRLFRIFSRRYTAHKPAIRAWVDVSMSMFQSEAENSQFRVFPFPLSPRRQWTFILSLRRRAADWSLDGLPYGFRNVLALAMAKRAGRAVAIAKLERDAFSRYADELISGRVAAIYTSDEFEIGAVVAGRALLAAAVPHVNCAHGVGLYCPNVAYGYFRYLTTSQADFYRKHNPGMQLEARQGQSVVSTSERPLPDENAPLAIVYIHQNFGLGQEAEAVAQNQILSGIASALSEVKAVGVIKLHPNSLAEAKSIQHENPKFILATDWVGLEKYRCVFVTINSTAYYLAIKAGPTLVYNGDTFYPSLYLDGPLLSFDLATLTARLEELAPYDEWQNWRDRAGAEAS